MAKKIGWVSPFVFTAVVTFFLLFSINKDNNGKSLDHPDSRNLYQIFEDDLGTEIYLISFDDDEEIDFDNLNITVLSQPGINGDHKNRYSWSSALDENDNLYIGTKNERIRWLKVPDYLLSIARAPPGKIWDAVVDGFLRQWSGTPFFESDGAEIYYYNQKDFELVFKAPKEHMGFRSMVYYQNEVYTGSSNGPDGPFDGDPYDFQFYKEGTGAKIFTTKNATTGQVFVQLDDQGLLDNFDKSIRSMCVSSYSDRLFIGTETYKCGKILVYDNTNGMNIWKQVETNEEDCSLSVSECLDIGEGRMLFGTWAAADYGLYLLDEKNQDSLTRIDTPNLFLHASCGIMELRVFQGHLYVGILSYLRGFALIRTKVDNLSRDHLNSNENSMEWNEITINGFKEEQREQIGARLSGNEYPWSTAVIQDTLFLSTSALSCRGINFGNLRKTFNCQGQLWATKDGENWTIIQSEVIEQAKSLYGFRTMQSTSDGRRLYMGTATNSYVPSF